MKQKILIGLALVFFLAIQVLYFWEICRGVSFTMMLALLAFFSLLAVIWFYKFIKAVRDGFRHRKRNILLVVLGLVILATVYRPFGLIDYEGIETTDVLIARDLHQNTCGETLRLKDNGAYTHIYNCFSISKQRGSYRRRGDSIFFEKHPEKIDYAVVKQGIIEKDYDYLVLHHYKDAPYEIDTVVFLITKQVK